MTHGIFGNIHQQPTRIIRHPIDEDGRTTIDLRRLVMAEGSRGTAACSTCTAPLARRAHFCGMCGFRVQRRSHSLGGTTLDNRYEVGELLAEGGFACVYRVRCLASGKELALKVLHAELAGDRRAVARFRREGKNLLRLRNRHTVATYDYGETAGIHYIVMELLRGDTVHERLRAGGPLPWRDILEIMRGVCSSLHEAHAHGIVHRDIKPANIVLDDTDGVKLIDFGLAKAYGDDDLTRAGQAVGTLHYMSPEQILGATCDGRSDIFALGVVGYQLLTGRRPFEDAKTASELLSALMHAPPPASSLRSKREVSDEVEQLLLRCLSPRPEARFADVAELAAAIDRILEWQTRAGFPHTPAFEREPPRIVGDRSPVLPPAPSRRLRGLVLWALGFATAGIGAGVVVAQLV